MSDLLKQLTADEFDAATSNGVALVDFWATWCGPCRQQLPILEKIAPDYAGKATVAKVNIDDEANKAVAVKFGIRSIPTLLLFKDGKLLQTFVGLQQEAFLRQVLDAAV
ncbi:MAG: thioredoxin [Kiritimatiellaeota bacterium]|nr:thioredoxin [Kiritimatiellota bacterium]